MSLAIQPTMNISVKFPSKFSASCFYPDSLFPTSLDQHKWSIPVLHGEVTCENIRKIMWPENSINFYPIAY
jgi:hypothetical protein